MQKWKARVRLAVVGAMCLSAGAAAAADNVRIGLAAANLFTAPVYAARDLGYYKDAGLNVDITAFTGGAAGQEALTAGAVDMITYVGSGIALAISKGAKEKIVAAIEPSPYAWHLLVHVDSPYKTVKDLAGKKVGITSKASTSDLVALWAAERAGIKIQTVPLGAGQVPVFKAKGVDAIAINPTSLQLLANGSARSLVDFGREMPPSLADVWGASQTFIDKHPEDLRKTLSAIYRALAYMRANRAWALNYLKDFTKEDNEKVVELSYQEGTLAQSKDGVIKKEWLKAALDQAINIWGAPELKTLTIEQIYSDKFTPIVTTP